mmetsp:Transcript_3121/g.3959  ORF Transcript_3121/g.3959 Transcript_3121/m.3959 type:complete len:214 (+) Transcript_3121:219-860(+)|eukprot:CAMPEP_0204853254 /NCGR_PEP_ID=MMETSP1347-20130617/13042_1 /ASSEMBLY_ACC=CAM_ASM_000690 /TAXON_ID=215587 /ORGANISM="Aplanochytrium stocchinoi, Strain GSBS06" /LENGTH=213 /DNA_ID=CAMNT_0051998019 /DNA_START=145 /DNA_END=786 /DNA_ORIENTATION=-
MATPSASTPEKEKGQEKCILGELPKVVNGTAFVPFKDETQMPDITAMIGKDLSEPYSIFTYRYFILGWPKLCLLAFDEEGHGEMVGVVICKVDKRSAERGGHLRGYIGMLTVKDSCRRKGIGSMLVERAIRKMIELNCAEAVLETEVSNRGALNLYENLGFIRDKRLEKYYLNGQDAFRLKLSLRPYHQNQKQKDYKDDDQEGHTGEKNKKKT